MSDLVKVLPYIAPFIPALFNILSNAVAGHKATVEEVQWYPMIKGLEDLVAAVRSPEGKTTRATVEEILADVGSPDGRLKTNIYKMKKALDGR